MSPSMWSPSMWSLLEPKIHYILDIRYLIFTSTKYADCHSHTYLQRVQYHVMDTLINGWHKEWYGKTMLSVPGVIFDKFMHNPGTLSSLHYSYTVKRHGETCLLCFRGDYCHIDVLSRLQCKLWTVRWTLQFPVGSMLCYLLYYILSNVQCAMNTEYDEQYSAVDCISIQCTKFKWQLLQYSALKLFAVL